MTQSTSARRFEGSTYLERVRDWLSEKYAGRNLELVVAVTEDALEFLAAERGVLWPGVPVLFVDLSSGRPDAVDGLPRAGGMLLEDFFSESFQLVKKILPETRQVVLAYGGSEVEREKRPSRQGGARPEPGSRARRLGRPAAGRNARRGGSTPPRDGVFLLGPYVDDAGRVLTGRQTCGTAPGAGSRRKAKCSFASRTCGATGALSSSRPSPSLWRRLIGFKLVMDSETGPVTISDFLSPDAVVGNFEAGDRVVATGTVAGGDFRADSVQKDK